MQKQSPHCRPAMIRRLTTRAHTCLGLLLCLLLSGGIILRVQAALTHHAQQQQEAGAPAGADLFPALMAALPLPAIAALLFLRRRVAEGWFLLILCLLGAVLADLLIRRDPELLVSLAFVVYPLNLAACALVLAYLLFAALRRVVDKMDRVEDLPPRR